VEAPRGRFKKIGRSSIGIGEWRGFRWGFTGVKQVEDRKKWKGAIKKRSKKRETNPVIPRSVPHSHNSLLIGSYV
tara:strand:- start:332 stop:556 length:225 start_codon:yes stop_codon:yes gene_type:complete